METRPAAFLPQTLEKLASPSAGFALRNQKTMRHENIGVFQFRIGQRGGLRGSVEKRLARTEVVEAEKVFDRRDAQREIEAQRRSPSSRISKVSG